MGFRVIEYFKQIKFSGNQVFGLSGFSEYRVFRAIEFLRISSFSVYRVFGVSSFSGIRNFRGIEFFRESKFSGNRVYRGTIFFLLRGDCWNESVERQGPRLSATKQSLIKSKWLNCHFKLKKNVEKLLRYASQEIVHSHFNFNFILIFIIRLDFGWISQSQIHPKFDYRDFQIQPKIAYRRKSHESWIMIIIFRLIF